MSGPTPWQKVFSLFNCSQRGLARAMGYDPSMVNRKLKSDEGLLSDKDQKALLIAADKMGVVIPADYALPPGFAR